ncbi:SDR family NAD(P)-dependent oxidoreductase [Lactococcus insecticola]|uniref:Carbonyl reductase n=1 Tax=Pseudolactococcus insecticola TaxID=2709158 RepID=A0A6A0B8T3_9LACT|nr:SDR family NAD(P)-dependent oxidoreductase [Lactococcus insecticola]GFH40878.1 carbonyl reductase [Lactococcus insecticola]
MKTALVTGANKGIGFEIAKQLGLSGWRVVVGARDASRGKAAVATLKALGISASWQAIDLTDSATLDAVGKQLENSDLSLLVNNAGIPGNQELIGYDTPLADLRSTMEVNFFGTFALTQALLPILEASHGQIVNITVPTSPNVFLNPFAYKTSKAAQNTMTTSMALWLEHENQTTTIAGIHPGPVTTDLNGNMTGDFMQDAPTVGEKIVALINNGLANGTLVELDGMAMP